MYTISYSVRHTTLSALITDLARPIKAATLALTRLDERLAPRGQDPAHDALASGAWARAHLSGELASVEDLVLLDAGMDVRAPSTGVVRAAHVLAERRQLARRAPEAVLVPDAVRRLIGARDKVAAGEGRREPDGSDAVPGARGAGRSPRTPHPWDMPRPVGRDEDALWSENDDPDVNGDFVLLGAEGSGGEASAVDPLDAGDAGLDQ